MLTREQAREYISFCVDDALNERSIDDMPDNARLVGWQCGYEPFIVAVWSYLSDTAGNRDRVDDVDAEEIAIDLLVERAWFTTMGVDGDPPPPDFII
jgi:hypothetical protein